MNKWIGSGSIAALSIRQTQAGKLCAWMSLGCPDGEGHRDFLDVIAWGAQAQRLKDFGRKGMQAEITGRVHRRKYTDNAGAEVYRTEIVADVVWLPNIRPVVKCDENGEVLQDE